MTAPFTNLTADLWRWNEWLALEHGHDDLVGRCTKLFWLALYTSHDAKRSVPGIFCGSITTMAEAARVGVDDAIKYLDRLLEHEMVEFDQENRVLRLTKLPGFGDAAGSNGKVIKGWWTQFNRVPQCAVRDAHVTTLKWMIEEWRRFKGEPLTPDQAKAWAETFARVTIPAPRKRGVRRLLDADTSTDTQPSLFGPPASPSNSLPGGPDTLSKTVQISSEASSGTNPQLADSSSSDTLSKPFREGLINPPDPDPDFGSGTGTGNQISEGVGGRAVGHLRVLEGGNEPSEVVDGYIETLAAVPGAKFTRTPTTEQRRALSHAIGHAAGLATRPGALALLRDYMSHGAPGMPKPQTAEDRATHGPAGISYELVTAPGWLGTALQHAFNWKAQTDDRSAMLASIREQQGF